MESEEKNKPFNSEISLISLIFPNLSSFALSQMKRKMLKFIYCFVHFYFYNLISKYEIECYL